MLLINSVNSAGLNTNKDEVNNSEQPEEMVQKNTVTLQGLKVYIDPDTGDLTNPPDDETGLSQPNNAIIDNGSNAMEQPEEIINPDGSATVVMPDSFQHSTKINIDDNGKQITECVIEHEHQ